MAQLSPGGSPIDATVQNLPTMPGARRYKRRIVREVWGCLPDDRAAADAPNAILRRTCIRFNASACPLETICPCRNSPD